jgi:hypothetical protein
VREDKPTNNTADNITRRKRNVDIEGLKFTEPCSLEEDNGESEEGISTENLSCPYNTVLFKTLLVSDVI